jgi:hypothetical protein
MVTASPLRMRLVLKFVKQGEKVVTGSLHWNPTEQELKRNLSVKM